jgi:hypothetical protein
LSHKKDFSQKQPKVTKDVPTHPFLLSAFPISAFLPKALCVFARDLFFSSIQPVSPSHKAWFSRAKLAKTQSFFESGQKTQSEEFSQKQTKVTKDVPIL